MSDAPEAPPRAGPLPFEWAAMALLVMLLAIQLFWSHLYEATWVLGMVLHLSLWFIGIVLAGSGLVLALQSSEQTVHRVRGAIAVPAALLLAMALGGPVLWLGFSLQGEWRLWWNGAAYEAAITRAGGGPQAFPILEGIPDGGVSLIYFPSGSPAKLSQTDMIALVGERIHHCRSLRRDWHVCAFD